MFSLIDYIWYLVFTLMCWNLFFGAYTRQGWLSPTPHIYLASFFDDTIVLASSPEGLERLIASPSSFYDL